jgi:hypothetical protein
MVGLRIPQAQLELLLLNTRLSLHCSVEVVLKPVVLAQWLMGHIDSMEGTPIPLLLVLAERGTEKATNLFLEYLKLLLVVGETKLAAALRREEILHLTKTP